MMMKRLLSYFILLLISALIGVAISGHSGYVFVAYDNTTIESTLWVALLLLLLVFVVVYGLLRFGYAITHLSCGVDGFIQRYCHNKAQFHFMQGLQKLLESDWGQAEKLIAQSVNYEETVRQEDIPLIGLVNYLTASYAANKQLNYAQRNYYLDTAQRLYGDNREVAFTISLCRLRLLLQSNQGEEAAALLCRLIHDHRRHRRALKKIQAHYFATERFVDHVNESKHPCT